MASAREIDKINADGSVSKEMMGCFPVEVTEIADWKSRSEYMLHSNSRKNPDKGSLVGIVVHIPL